MSGGYPAENLDGLTIGAVYTQSPKPPNPYIVARGFGGWFVIQLIKASFILTLRMATASIEIVSERRRSIIGPIAVNFRRRFLSPPDFQAQHITIVLTRKRIYVQCSRAKEQIFLIPFFVVKTASIYL